MQIQSSSMTGKADLGTPMMGDVDHVDHSPIELHLCKGNVLVWNADDVKTLRATHHIVGALVGSLPRSPRQNAQLSLPLQLMSEEAAVLIEYGVAKLVNVKIKMPSSDDIAAFNKTRQKSFEEQRALMDAENLKRKRDFQHVVAMGQMSKKQRRAERAKKLKRERIVCSADPCEDRGDNSASQGEEMSDSGKQDAVAMETQSQDHTKDVSSSEDCDGTIETAINIEQSNPDLVPKEESCPLLKGVLTEGEERFGIYGSEASTPMPEPDSQETRKSIPQSVQDNLSQSSVTATEASRPLSNPEYGQAKNEQQKSMSHVVKEASSDIFKKPSNPQPCSAYLVQLVTASSDTIKQDVTEWAFPSTKLEALRYRVFRDLWETGYYITSGCKFGGDFLVYPGDPFLFHSDFVAICIPHEKSLSPLDVITYGRLGTNVKKTVVLCSLDDSDKVVYTSIQWTGIS